MALTADQRKQVLRECGEDENTSPYLAIMPALEAAHAAEEAVDARLLPLWVRHDILNALAGSAARDVDHKEGDEDEKSSQAFNALHKLLDDTKSEIADVVQGLGGGAVQVSRLCEPEAVCKLSLS